MQDEIEFHYYHDGMAFSLLVRARNLQKENPELSVWDLLEAAARQCPGWQLAEALVSRLGTLEKAIEVMEKYAEEQSKCTS